MNKEETIRLLKNISCKNCRHLHLKLRSKFDPPDRKEIFCGKNVIRAHEGIIDLPEKRYCNSWDGAPNGINLAKHYLMHSDKITT